MHSPRKKGGQCYYDLLWSPGRDIRRDAVLDFVGQLPQRTIQRDHLPDTESATVFFGHDRKIEKLRHGQKNI